MARVPWIPFWNARQCVRWNARTWSGPFHLVSVLNRVSKVQLRRTHTGSKEIVTQTVVEFNTHYNMVQTLFTALKVPIRATSSRCVTCLPAY